MRARELPGSSRPRADESGLGEERYLDVAIPCAFAYTHTRRVHGDAPSDDQVNWTHGIQIDTLSDLHRSTPIGRSLRGDRNDPWVQGDAWQGNLVVPDGGSPILLDFDHVSIGHLAWDLIPLAVDYEDFARISSYDYTAFVSDYGGYDVRDAHWFRTLADLQELRWTAFVADKSAHNLAAAAEVSHRLACLQGKVPRPWRWAAF